MPSEFRCTFAVPLPDGIFEEAERIALLRPVVENLRTRLREAIGGLEPALVLPAIEFAVVPVEVGQETAAAPAVAEPEAPKPRRGRPPGSRNADPAPEPEPVRQPDPPTPGTAVEPPADPPPAEPDGPAQPSLAVEPAPAIQAEKRLPPWQRKPEPATAEEVA